MSERWDDPDASAGERAPVRAAGAAARDRSRRQPPPPTRPSRAWGTRPGRLGPFTVLIGTALGGLVTVLAGREPGLVLGVFVIVSTGVGVFAVRPGSAYLTIPVPAPAYIVVAVIVGLIHDRHVDTSRAVLAVNAAQWIASGFVAMTAATVLAVGVAVGRWLVVRKTGRRRA